MYNIVQVLIEKKMVIIIVLAVFDLLFCKNC